MVVETPRLLLLVFLVGVNVPDPPALAPGPDRINIERTPGPIDCNVKLVVLPLRDPALDSDLEPGNLVNDPFPNPKIV